MRMYRRRDPLCNQSLIKLVSADVSQEVITALKGSRLRENQQTGGGIGRRTARFGGPKVADSCLATTPWHELQLAVTAWVGRNLL